MKLLRTMYDSVDAHAIPPSASMIAAYVDGRDTAGNFAAVHRRFPHARLVQITTTGASLGAHMADIETGDLTPKSGAAWAVRKIRHGGHPTLYFSLSLWPEVEAEVRKTGLDPRVDVSYAIAHYDGSRAIPAGAIAVQYAAPSVPAGHPGHSPGHYDIWAVAPYWAGVDPVPHTMTAHQAHLQHLHHLHLLHELHTGHH